MKKRSIKLYNLIFPIWALVIFPQILIFVLPANFIIDSLVLLITMKILKVDNIKSNYKAIISKVWIFGFVSDFIGGIFMFLSVYMYVDSENKFHDLIYEISSSIQYNPFNNIISLIYTILCVLISGVLIYILNYKKSFTKTNLDIR